MKPANDPDTNYKALVEQGYDRCAQAYARDRQEQAHPALDSLMDKLEAGAKVLDIGCGAGMPVTRTLAEKFEVTGVDISAQMLGLAKATNPNVEFIHNDIMELRFPDNNFGAIVSFYAIFHLPREEHAELFRRIHTWLKPGGYFLATVAATSEEAYTEDDFFDTTMYWSNFGLAEYQQLLINLGFELLDSVIVGHGYYPDEGRPVEQHPLIFAQKV